MEITEVRVALREGSTRPGAREGRMGPGSSVPTGAGTGERRLKAYATLTFDQCFVVRNLKVIEGKNGLFVAMPSRKPKVSCGRCGFKGDFGGRFCVQCGAVMPPAERAAPAGEGEHAAATSHRDIAHPITAEFRQYLQQKVLDAYEEEAERAKAREPGGSGPHGSSEEIG